MTERRDGDDAIIEQVAHVIAEGIIKPFTTTEIAWSLAETGLLRDPVKEADPQWSREQVQRVLYTVVASYDQAHAELGGDSEFLRDAIRIGRQTLIDNDWWPGSGVSTTGADSD